MWFGYLTSSCDPEVPTCEIGLKVDRRIWTESGQKDLIVHSVKCSRQIQENENEKEK